MKVVIEIPDGRYKQLMADDIYLDVPIFKEDIIATLPKGHGRLGDLSKIYVELNEAQIEGTEEYKGLGEAKQMICDAPTIIEADDAESEGEG